MVPVAYLANCRKPECYAGVVDASSETGLLRIRFAR
jgi:hypothetical protein